MYRPPTVGIGRGKNIAMCARLMQNDEDDEEEDSDGEKSLDDDYEMAEEEKNSVEHNNMNEKHINDKVEAIETIDDGIDTTSFTGSYTIPSSNLDFNVIEMKPETVPEITTKIDAKEKVNRIEVTKPALQPVKKEVKEVMVQQIMETEAKPIELATIAAAAAAAAVVHVKHEIVDTAKMQEEEEAAIETTKVKKKLKLAEYLKRRRDLLVAPIENKYNRSNFTLDSLVSKNTPHNNNNNNNIGNSIKAEQEAIDETINVSANLTDNLEEIVIVSIGCNTELSIAPKSNCDSNNGLNKTNSLFCKINDTLIKAQGENVQISSNSLIASIQDVLLKKCIPTESSITSSLSTTTSSPTPLPIKKDSSDKMNNMVATNSCSDSHLKAKATPTPLLAMEKKPCYEEVVEEHGEDKIIMHLRKDRIKAPTSTIAIQTDCLLQFPTLKKFERIDTIHKYRSKGKSNDRDVTYSSSSDYRLDRKRACSPGSDDYFMSSQRKSRRYGSHQQQRRSPSPIADKYCSKQMYNSSSTEMNSRKPVTTSRNGSLSTSESDSSQSDHSRSYSKYAYKTKEQRNQRQRQIGELKCLVIFCCTMFAY